MSDAIELSIGGSNKGFVAVLDDTKKRAKQTANEITIAFDEVRFGDRNGSSGGMSKKFLAEKDKISAGTKDLAAEFSKATGISSAFGDTLGKIGSMARSGGGIASAVTVMAAFGKAVYDAHQAAGALDLAIEKISKRNAGGTENKTTGDIEETIADIRERRKKLFDQNRHKGEAFQGAKDWMDAAKTELSDTLETGRIGSGATAKRDAQLRQEELKALDQLGEKQKTLTGIVRERVEGSKEEAEIMALQAEYAEKIDKARDKGKGSAGHVQSLTEERELKEAEIRRTAEGARIARAGSFAESYIIGRDAGKTDNVQLAQAKLSTAKNLAANAGTEEEKKNAEAGVEAANASLKVAEHEEEIRSRISRNDMEVANLRGSMADRQENALKKQIQLSQQLLKDAKGRIETDERGVALARDRRTLEEYQAQRKNSEIDSDTGMANSRIGAINSRSWRTNSDEGTQRSGMDARALQSKMSLNSAQDKIGEFKKNNPGSDVPIEMVNAQKKAEDDMTIATEARAKWERDIARSKGDAVKAAKAQNESTEYDFKGLSAASEFTKSRAANEAAIARAMREGNTELAKQLELQGENSAKSQVRSRFVTPGGRVRSQSEVRRQMQKERSQAARVNRLMSNLESNDYISGASHDSSGRVTGGFDMLTGKDVNVDPLNDRLYGESRGRKNGLFDKDGEFVRGGLHTNLATNEMNYRGNVASSQAETEAAKKEMDKGVAGKAHPAISLERLTQILESWNN